MGVSNLPCDDLNRTRLTVGGIVCSRAFLAAGRNSIRKGVLVFFIGFAVRDRDNERRSLEVLFLVEDIVHKRLEDLFVETCPELGGSAGLEVEFGADIASPDVVETPIIPVQEANVHTHALRRKRVHEHANVVNKIGLGGPSISLHGSTVICSQHLHQRILIRLPLTSRKPTAVKNRLVQGTAQLLVELARILGLRAGIFLSLPCFVRNVIDQRMVRWVCVVETHIFDDLPD